MTLSSADILLYAGAMLVLFLTPGPVWLALLARGMSGGFAAAWPLAVGVAVGDMVWPLLAVLGVSWIVSVYAGFLDVMRVVAVVMFLGMGGLLILNAGKSITTDQRLTRPGMWAGFLAGLAVILSNPKAVLFYMGVLPGFFDLTRIGVLDIAVIVVISFVVPLTGNLILAFFIDRLRRYLTSAQALRRTNIVSGSLLIVVGVVIWWLP